MSGRLLERLGSDLARRRVLSPQVRRHVSSTYGVADDTVREFFASRLDELEEFQIELLLGPLFTPTLEDRAGYVAALREEVPDEAQVDEYVRTLEAERLTWALEISGEEDVQVKVFDVLVARWVRLCELTSAPGAALAGAVARAVPGDDQDLALAVLREPAWRDNDKRNWLVEYLQTAATRQSFSMQKLEFLTDLVRSQYEARTERMLELAQKVLEERRSQWLETGSAKPFFARHIEEWHGHERDQRRVDPAEAESRQERLAVLEDLARDFEAMLGR